MLAKKILGGPVPASKPARKLAAGVYLAPELKRLSHRKGAYDAFDKPSIYAGRPAPYAPPKARP